MRCPDCQKFVAYDTEVEPEVNSVEFDGDTFTSEVTRALNCGECGNILKSAELTVEADGVKEDTTPEDACPDDEHEWDAEATATPEMRVKDTDRHGRKIKYARYMTTEYGVTVEFTARCSKCGQEVSATGEEYIAASGMDEQV